jgi:hypothetical protein
MTNLVRRPRLVAMGLAAATVGAVSAGAALEAGARITPAPDRSSENKRAATKIARAITERKDVRFTKARFSAIPPESNPAAVSTTRMAGFPLKGRSFAILSNGDATDADNPNNAPDSSTSLGGPSIRGSRDVVIYRIHVRVPKGRDCLSVRFRFLSEEYPEFVGTEFNDAFIAELDDSTWNTITKDDPRVEAPRNFARTADGKLITVNATGETNVSPSRAKGTTYDAATRRLRASTRVSRGSHILYLSIFDQGDRQFDSAVFVDGITVDRRRPCEPGAVQD